MLRRRRWGQNRAVWPSSVGNVPTGSAVSTIAVIGSANADLVVLVERRPSGGETLLGSDLVITPGGKGANQAVACARAGGAATPSVALDTASMTFGSTASVVGGSCAGTACTGEFNGFLAHLLGDFINAFIKQRRCVGSFGRVHFPVVDDRL